MLQDTINSFLKIPLKKKLFLVDNSPISSLSFLGKHKDVEYFFNNKNLGFASGHNLVLNNVKDSSNYHLILNPDVIFSPSVILNLIKKLSQEKEVAMIAPKVIFPNGKLQYSCRKHPKPIDLIIRRLNIKKNRVYDKEYQNRDLTKAFNPNCISGCFMLFKTNDFISINGFDTRYFMYLEDFDICKKIDAFGKKKLYYPGEEIIHIANYGSTKKTTLFFIHVFSAIKYFNKWGWR